MNTFTYLYYTVFPALGDAFGQLSAVAQMSYTNFASMLMGKGGVFYYYTNVFNGVVDSNYFSLGWVGQIFSVITRFIVPTSLYTSPLWVVLLYCSFTIFIGVALLKFFLNVF